MQVVSQMSKQMTDFIVIVPMCDTIHQIQMDFFRQWKFLINL